MVELRERWDRLDALLKQALDGLGNDLASSHRDLVADFIDNREYGVALEWLTSAATAQGVRISSTAKAAIAEAASLMQA